MTLEQLWNHAEAVLFDFDGVLADSEPFYRKSWNRVLSTYHHSVPEQVYWEHWAYLGQGVEGEIERTGLRIDNIPGAKMKQKSIYRQYCLSGCIPLFSNAADLVCQVMARKKCAIASNTDSELVKLIASREICHLPPVIGGDGLRSKPAPDIFLKASEFLGVQPERCLVLEDAMKGILAGTAAGMPVILVRNRYNAGFSCSGASFEIDGIGTFRRFLEEVTC